METETYIQAVLPLKLGWEPLYRCRFDVRRGDRVRVTLSGKEYPAVVLRCNVSPIDGGRLQEVTAKEDLPPISEEQLRLWNFISDYYLCTLGEVFKAAVPSSEGTAPKKPRKASAQDISLRHPSLSDSLKSAVTQILSHFSEGKTVLLQCWEGLEKIYSELICRCIENGRDVLWLSDAPERLPQIAGARVITSKTPAAARRETCRLLRESTDPQIVTGTKQAVFLPWRKLGLVIVDQEQSPQYKQEAVSPRFNGRDVALALARIHGADAILGTATPSLESWYNAQTQRFSLVQAGSSIPCPHLFIDTTAERRKRGGVGEYYTRKSLSRVKQILEGGGKVLFLLPWNDTRDAEIEARSILGKVGERIIFRSLRAVSDEELEHFPLTVLLKAEYLLSRQDLRADERALQSLRRLLGCCQELIVQTSRFEHPVFSDTDNCFDALLLERKAFGAPPFTREVDVCTPAKDGTRMIAGKMYRVTPHFLPKDGTLAQRKAEIVAAAPRTAVIDVDPV